MSAAVVDALTGEVLYDRAGDRPAVPASAVKILTGMAALDLVLPEGALAASGGETGHLQLGLTVALLVAGRVMRL